VQLGNPEQGAHGELLGIERLRQKIDGPTQRIERACLLPSESHSPQPQLLVEQEASAPGQLFFYSTDAGGAEKRKRSSRTASALRRWCWWKLPVLQSMTIMSSEFS
jgi:hypothetical protein